MHVAVILITVFAYARGSHITEFLIVDDATKQQLTEMVNGCIEQVGGASNMMDEIDKGNFLDPKDEKCLLECYLTKSGFMLANGDFDVPKVKAVYDKKYNDLIDECNKLHDNSKCVKAYNGYKCVVNGVKN